MLEELLVLSVGLRERLSRLQMVPIRCKLPIQSLTFFHRYWLSITVLFLAILVIYTVGARTTWLCQSLKHAQREQI